MAVVVGLRYSIMGLRQQFKDKAIMVPSNVYFSYLKTAFRRNHISGYATDKRVRDQTCIFMEDGNWIVAKVTGNNLVDPRIYDLNSLWNACEDIISRLVKDEALRKKVWMEWASPTDLQEKWDEPIVAFPVLSNEVKEEIVPIVKEVMDQIDPWTLIGHGIPDCFTSEASWIAKNITRESDVEEIAMAVSSFMNSRYGLESSCEDYLKYAKQIHERLNINRK